MNQSIHSEERARLQSRMIQEQHKRDQEGFKKLLAIPEFRRYLMRQMERCKVYSSTFTGDSETFRNEGMRLVGLMMLKDIEDLGEEGLKLKHLAEVEYINEQKEILYFLMEEDKKVQE